MDGSILREYYLIIKNKILNERFESALSSCEKLLYNFPSDEWGYYYKGVCEFALEKYPLAIKHYSTAIQLNPGFAQAYFNLAICFFLAKKYDMALINIGKALIIFTKQKELDKKQRCIDALKTIEVERRLR